MKSLPEMIGLALRASRSARPKLVLILALLLCISAPPRLHAADYAIQKTFWSFQGTWTNAVNVDTNLNQAIDCTQFTDFALQLTAIGTNAASAGIGYSIVWETSLDGSNWPTMYTNNAPGTVGWFAIPYTNNIALNWSTNITMNSVGYWRIRSVTNASSLCVTNLTLRGYVKPKRTNRDF